MGFVRAASAADVPPGKMFEASVEDKSVALANVSGKICAFSNICAHQGGPLCEGDLVGQEVTCPWHAWTYDVTTGKLAGNAEIGLETYPVEVRGGDIYVDVG
jgi:nitrite reductase/ring-hydroxylating ferredoxin subunit